MIQEEQEIVSFRPRAQARLCSSHTRSFLRLLHSGFIPSWEYQYGCNTGKRNCLRRHMLTEDDNRTIAATASRTIKS
ncbi:hypothetical protein C5167_043096 [Papaver somniferum]|uniref:Uncharacterized protein n=1 Tax=Papaver somniferum TaxID=3469 RepID=A0A4Y7L7U8_PAPSO|nr:hypothetical protein C5167_043096 [Papaver somniferum]